MMKKKQNITIAQGRSVTKFFNRVLENFERKFDGFPALIEGANETPAMVENADPYADYNPQDIIDAIARAALDAGADQCPDCTSGCGSGEVTTDSLLTSDFTSYTTPVPNKYILDVSYDDLRAVRDIDYTVVDGVVVVSPPLDADTIVKARFRIL